MTALLALTLLTQQPVELVIHGSRDRSKRGVCVCSYEYYSWPCASSTDYDEPTGYCTLTIKLSPAIKAPSTN